MTSKKLELRVLKGGGTSPAPSIDDGQLLAAVRAGDQRAAAALYDRARPSVDATIRRLIAARKLPAVRVGRSVRIVRIALDRMLAKGGTQ